MEIKGKPLAKEHTKLRLDYRIRGDISDALIEAYCKAEMPPAAKVKDVAQYVEDYWHGIRLENYETETLDNNSEFEKDKVEYVYAIGGENCIKDLVPWIELEFYCTVMRLTCDSLEEVTKTCIESGAWGSLEASLAITRGYLYLVLYSENHEDYAGYMSNTGTFTIMDVMLRYFFTGYKPDIKYEDGECYAYFLNKIGYLEC